jgi:hypothetical protein
MLWFVRNIRPKGTRPFCGNEPCQSDMQECKHVDRVRI